MYQHLLSCLLSENVPVLVYLVDSLDQIAQIIHYCLTQSSISFILKIVHLDCSIS